MVGETGNLVHHIFLSNLRENETIYRRKIPREGLFKKVSYPHYLFEIISWVGFCIAQPCVYSFAFLALSFAILVSWATTGHRKYHEFFSGTEGKPKYPANRKIIFPGIY